MPNESGAEGSGSKADATNADSSIRFKLNGEEVTVPTGTTIIEAAHARGIDVPYFCYHPGLTPEGNCRMCLVEASNSSKPVPACTTRVTADMEVQTHSEGAATARADVLEFMLVNHPLDCPICDKSGECMLQDNSYDHGNDHSRMIEPKQLRPTKDLGNDIHIWGNRCIVCTRCVRFCDEISGSGELCVVERGDRSVVDVFPEYPLGNPLSGNVVDICPVGALISKDFLYQARVWYEKRTPGICNGCARGCNIEIQTLHNKIRRLVPRHNAEVNDYWMCDRGRYDYKYVLGPNRWLRCRLGAASSRDVYPAVSAAAGGKFLLEGLARVARERGPQALGGVASAFMTLEALYLFRRLLEAVGAPPENIAARARPGGEEQVFKGGFKISGDDNPNRSGVARILGENAFDRQQSLMDKARSGDVRGLVLFSDLPGCRLEDGWIEALEALDFALVFLLEGDERIPDSAGLIPATAFSEKQGTLINEDQRLQLMHRATELPRGIPSELDVLQEALRLEGRWKATMSPAGVFQEVANAVPELDGMTHGGIGSLGVSLGDGPGGEA